MIIDPLYNIQYLCPLTDGMGGCGFFIQLFPNWKKLVAQSGYTQSNIDALVHNDHRRWLDGHGFDSMFGEGKDAEPLYNERDVRIKWGEWGPEHLTVPGDACGLDVENHMHGLQAPKDGAILVPHNVDGIRQSHLLLVMFTSIANVLISKHEYEKHYQSTEGGVSA